MSKKFVSKKPPVQQPTDIVTSTSSSSSTITRTFTTEKLPVPPRTQTTVEQWLTPVNKRKSPSTPSPAPQLFSEPERMVKLQKYLVDNGWLSTTNLMTKPTIPPPSRPAPSPPDAPKIGIRLSAPTKSTPSVPVKSVSLHVRIPNTTIASTSGKRKRLEVDLTQEDEMPPLEPFTPPRDN